MKVGWMDGCFFSVCLLALTKDPELWEKGWNENLQLIVNEYNIDRCKDYNWAMTANREATSKIMRRRTHKNLYRNLCRLTNKSQSVISLIHFTKDVYVFEKKYLSWNKYSDVLRKIASCWNSKVSISKFYILIRTIKNEDNSLNLSIVEGSRNINRFPLNSFLWYTTNWNINQIKTRRIRISRVVKNIKPLH